MSPRHYIENGRPRVAIFFMLRGWDDWDRWEIEWLEDLLEELFAQHKMKDGDHTAHRRQELNKVGGVDRPHDIDFIIFG